MDGDLAILQRRQFGLIIVHQNDIVSEIGKASACHQPYVSRTHDRNPHVKTPVMECSETSFVWDASTKKLRRIRKAAWENSSTSSQDGNDFNSIEPKIGRREKSVTRWFDSVSSPIGDAGPGLKVRLADWS